MNSLIMLNVLIDDMQLYELDDDYLILSIKIEKF